MGPAPRRPSDDMSEAPRQTDELFGLLQDMERAAPGKPQIGKSRRAADDVVRFGHAPHLDFAVTTAEFGEKARAPGTPEFLRVYFMGLLGPMGPLPLQMSELAIFERRYAKERPYGAFLDVLANRMIQLFYRAWADAEPSTGAGRAEADIFRHYVAALGAQADASPHEEIDRVQLALLGHAGHTGGRRSPAAIADAALAILGLEAEIVEFVGVWQKLEEDDATRLGDRAFGLGGGATIGLSVYTVQDSCLVRLKFRDLATFQAHLPGTAGFTLVSRVLSALVPSHLEWRIEYELPRREIPAARLGGGAQLGWTGWMGAQGEGPPRRDLRLVPQGAMQSF